MECGMCGHEGPGDLAAIRQRVQRNGNDEHDVPF